jgi:flagellar biosynthesis/type III secretory pathway chaperone
VKAPAETAIQSPLEAALLDVQSTLADLLVAADEQYAAVVARDHVRLEGVTRQQERLSVRLARAEARRLELLAGSPLLEAVSTLPEAEAARAEVLRQSIATAVQELKRRHARTAGLLARSIELSKQTLDFLQRLVTGPAPAYGARGIALARHSVLVDTRA